MRVRVRFKNVNLEPLADFVEIDGRRVLWSELLQVKPCEGGVSVDVDICKKKYKTKNKDKSNLTEYIFSCDTLRIPETINGSTVVNIEKAFSFSSYSYCPSPGGFAGWRDFQVSEVTRCEYNIKKLIYPNTVRNFDPVPICNIGTDNDTVVYINTPNLPDFTKS